MRFQIHYIVHLPLRNLFMATVSLIIFLNVGCSRSVDTTMRPSVKQLLANGSDSEICNGVFVKISRKYNERMVPLEYTDTERVLMLVWHAMGIIGNGGFEYLFSADYRGDPGYQLVAQAFKTLGAPRAEEAFSEVLALFPNSRPHLDRDERIKHFQSIDKSRREAINEKFWAAYNDGEIRRKMAEYIRKHQDEFLRLD